MSSLIASTYKGRALILLFMRSIDGLVKIYLVPQVGYPGKNFDESSTVSFLYVTWNMDQVLRRGSGARFGFALNTWEGGQMILLSHALG